MKKVLRSVMDALPAPMSVALDNWQQGARHAAVRALRARRDELYAKAGSPTTIQQGPFQGMGYLCWHATGNFLPNVLGCYELELHDQVERVIAMEPDAVINVGSAEGYFTLGMGRRLPKTKLIAFEMLKSARYFLAKNAELNGLRDRVDQRGICTADELNQVLGEFKKPMVFCDCEGFEDVALDPARVKNIVRAIIMVEVHDGPGFAPGVSQRLLDRFKVTHEIAIVKSRPRTPADKPKGCPMSDADFLEAVAEIRGLDGLWYVMVPKS